MRKLILLNAIVWASLLIASALLFKGHDNWSYLFILLTSGFTIVNSLLLVRAKKEKRTCAFVKADK